MQRSRRVTMKQKAYMMDFLEKNPETLTMSHPRLERELKWRELAKGLNSQLLGSSKTTAQWKDTYKDLRCRIRRQYRLSQLHKDKTYDLTPLEIRFLKTCTPDTLSLYMEQPIGDKEDSNDQTADNIACEETPETEFYGVSLKTESDNIPVGSQNNNSEENAQFRTKSSTSLPKRAKAYQRRNGIEESLNNRQYHKKDDLSEKRSRFQDILKTNFQGSLSTQIGSHAQTVEQLSQSCTSMAESIALLAQANNNVANAINNIAEKIGNYFSKKDS